MGPKKVNPQNFNLLWAAVNSLINCLCLWNFIFLPQLFVTMFRNKPFKRKEKKNTHIGRQTLARAHTHTQSLRGKDNLSINQWRGRECVLIAVSKPISRQRRRGKRCEIVPHQKSLSGENYVAGNSRGGDGETNTEGK